MMNKNKILMSDQIRDLFKKNKKHITRLMNILVDKKENSDDESIYYRKNMCYLARGVTSFFLKREGYDVRKGDVDLEKKVYGHQTHVFSLVPAHNPIIIHAAYLQMIPNIERYRQEIEVPDILVSSYEELELITNNLAIASHKLFNKPIDQVEEFFCNLFKYHDPQKLSKEDYLEDEFDRLKRVDTTRLPKKCVEDAFEYIIKNNLH